VVGEGIVRTEKMGKIEWVDLDPHLA